MMYKEYEVTITPKITTYALKQARADRRESEGRYGVPATFRAKLIK